MQTKGIRGKLQQSVAPQLGGALIIVAVIVAAYFLHRAATEKPPYPGQNAPKPAAERQGGMMGGMGGPARPP